MSVTKKLKTARKKKQKKGDKDLSKPFNEVLKCPFTRRIVKFSSPGHRLPANAKIYDGTGDPEDHTGRFVRIGNQGEWPMPEKFLNRFGMLKACDKDPAEISKIVHRANERWVSESNDIPSVPELIQISSFMRSHKCPELAKRFSDNVPKTVDEMLKRVDDYLWSEEAFHNTKLPRGEQEYIPAFTTTERNTPYVPPQRPNQEVRRPRAVLTLDSLSSTPQEILAIEHQLPLPQPAPPQPAPLQVKPLGDGREAERKRGSVERPTKRAIPSTIHGMMKFLTPWGVATLVSQTPVVLECRREGKKQAVEPPKERKAQDTISLTNQVLVNLAYPKQLITIGTGLSPEGSSQLKNLLKKNIDIFSWEPFDITGVPKRIIKHSLNANPLEKPISQKKRVFCPEKSRVITKEVAEWLKA
nr:reverse transcriptase domain-containing protein [Tanacetum cinerariifolium]